MSRCIYVLRFILVLRFKKKSEEQSFVFSCLLYIATCFIHYLPFAFPFATLIRVNRWRNWGKGLPWIGVNRGRGRSTLQEFHFDASSPTRLVSQRIFIQDAIRPPRSRSQERSVEKRSTIFRRELEFHSILEFSHECIFYRHRIESRYFGYRNKFHETFLSMNSANDKYMLLSLIYIYIEIIFSVIKIDFIYMYYKHINPLFVSFIANYHTYYNIDSFDLVFPLVLFFQVLGVNKNMAASFWNNA